MEKRVFTRVCKMQNTELLNKQNLSFADCTNS